jgi:hypothetical protein
MGSLFPLRHIKYFLMNPRGTETKIGRQGSERQRALKHIHSSKEMSSVNARHLISSEYTFLTPLSIFSTNGYERPCKPFCQFCLSLDPLRRDLCFNGNGQNLAPSAHTMATT